MPFQKGHPGGPGRPPKVVEAAQHSVLLELFDEVAERRVIRAQLKQAYAGDTTAATWLWDRKYGKVKEPREHSGTITYIVEYADPVAPDPTAFSPAADPPGGEAL